MPAPLEFEQPLLKWKGIASYLGINVRTAQLWASGRSLPVHRLPGRKGMVWAYRDELDSWKMGRPYTKPEKRVAGRRELQGWKAIAEFLNVAVRTVQEWEAKKSLPVHRLPGQKGGAYAWTDELECWRSGAVFEPLTVANGSSNGSVESWPCCIYCRKPFEPEFVTRHICLASLNGLHALEKTAESLKVLTEICHLTAAEARLTERLVAGQYLKKAAFELGISTYTARDHLKSIFEKTGVGGQTDLVRLVLTMVINGEQETHRQRDAISSMLTGPRWGSVRASRV